MNHSYLTTSSRTNNFHLKLLASKQQKHKSFPPPKNHKQFKNSPCHERPQKRSLVLPTGPSPITPEEYEALRNTVTTPDLEVLLAPAVAASGVCDKYLNTVSSWELDADLRPVRFSSRFSALWVRHQDTFVWFCVVDQEFLAFSLTDGPDLDIENIAGNLPKITLSRKGVMWTELQQKLVDNFELDDHVRAITAAVMLSSNPTGEFANVPNEMLCAQMRELESRLCYDSPLDEDMMTVLSDPKTADKGNTLYFECGGGHCAKSTFNESIGRVTRIESPEYFGPFKESSKMLLPFAFN